MTVALTPVVPATLLISVDNALKSVVVTAADMVEVLPPLPNVSVTVPAALKVLRIVLFVAAAVTPVLFSMAFTLLATVNARSPPTMLAVDVPKVPDTVNVCVAITLDAGGVAFGFAVAEVPKSAVALTALTKLFARCVVLAPAIVKLIV